MNCNLPRLYDFMTFGMTFGFMTFKKASPLPHLQTQGSAHPFR